MPSFAALMAASVPRAWWRLGELDTSGAAVDEMAAFPGVYTGNPASVSGLVGDANRAVRFAVAGQRMRANAGNILNAATDLSFAFFMDCDAVQPGNFRTPFGDVAAIVVGFYNVQPTNGLFGRFGGTADFMLSPGNKSGRHYYAFTLNAAGVFRSFADGVELVAGVGQPTAHTNVTVSDLHIGESGGGTNPSVATMDEPALWNRVLTPAEIAGFYNGWWSSGGGSADFPSAFSS